VLVLYLGDMIAFDVHLNGKKISTIGVGSVGVLSACLSWRGSQPYKKGGRPVSEYLKLDAGGLAESGEHLRWVDRRIKRGDEVGIKVVEVASVDKPRDRKRRNPAEDLRRQKEYVRRMVKQLGWKLQT